MATFFLIVVLIFIVVKFGITGLGCFVTFCVICHLFADKTKLKKESQEQKVKEIYGENTPYLKRSELTDADIENLRYQVENLDEILFTVNSVQELKLVLSRLHSCMPNQVTVFNSGEIKVKELFVNRWRYTPGGQIEYYVPALNSLKPPVEENLTEDFDADGDLEYLTGVYDVTDEEKQVWLEKSNEENRDNVIKGPW